MKIICTTSNKYLHLIPVFTYLFQKYWGNDPVEIVGYKMPSCKLPKNYTFHSMGEQGHVSEWSTDLRRYFESIPDQWLIWLMEDTFIKRMDRTSKAVLLSKASIQKRVGRIDLTNDIQKRGHGVINNLVFANDASLYRLSTQPSVWCKEFLLQYLTPGMDPWTFEKQNPINDGWEIVGLNTPPVKHNEGVRKLNPHELDLNGFSDEDVKHIQTLL